MHSNETVEPRVPRRERISPIESMGRTLVDAGTDLGDERACAEALNGIFLDTDITAFLDAAMDRARERKQGSDTTFSLVRDLAAVTIFIVAVFAWCHPARAASGVPLFTTESDLRVVWSIVLGVGLFGVGLGLTLIGVSRWLGRRGRA